MQQSLVETSLKSATRYSALSYAWDAQSPSCPIECYGGILNVTPNCQAALHRLRDKHELCQTKPKSEEERAWMNETLALVFGVGVHDSSQDVLGPAFKLSWFHRMWTVQEVTLPAVENVIVQYGPVSFPWLFLLLAMGLLKTTNYKWGKWDEATHLQRSITGMFMERSHSDWRKLLGIASSDALPYHGLLQLLAPMRSKKATDPKDKVFALFGVTEELGLDFPPPKYENPLERVYVETAVACIEQDRSLNILYEAPSNERHSALPSWVPDWSAEGWRSSYLRGYLGKGFRAAGDDSPQWSFSQDYRRLTISGKLIDSVDNCGTVLEFDKDFSNGPARLGIGATKFKDYLEDIRPPLTS
ncbi:hypothetical protein K469DRAFT_768996 [Zopfia rhizophila CBS 207.26]|uniref:Uncharacterized protein n=1 Tax=Zopfia rhizophila CBS 207.26 TaxID=1314779 RepID=A0A6A6ECS0_9PEZI|nr:hypothetical protein K469DRAFT_768996 [Zopfia rhizophila CBS 207.26]